MTKDAVEVVRDKDSLVFYSHMFLVVMKNDKFRRVINLKALYQTLDTAVYIHSLGYHVQQIYG